MNFFDSTKERLAQWKAQEAIANEFAEKMFTPRALQALAWARKEAARLNHDYIGTEHLLLGLIKLGQGAAVNVLKNLGLNLENVRWEVEKQVGIGANENLSGNFFYTPRLKKVLSMARMEAKAIDHTYTGTEDLLLGLLQEPEGLAAQVFKKFKVDLEKTRHEILEELTPIYPKGDNEPKQEG